MSSNFSHSEQFLYSFLAILRYRKSLKCLNWPFLNISQCFSRQFLNFPWKRSQILLSGADHGRKTHAGGLLGQWCLKENSKWKTKPVSGEEGHSTILLAHTKILVWKGPMTMRPWAPDIDAYSMCSLVRTKKTWMSISYLRRRVVCLNCPVSCRNILLTCEKPTASELCRKSCIIENDRSVWSP